MRRVTTKLAAALSVFGLIAGCSGAKQGSGFTQNENSAPGGGDGGSTLGGGNPNTLGGDSDGGATNVLDSGCATATAATARSPVYMLIVLDGSGSMGQENKWKAVVPALDTTFDQVLAQNDPSFGIGLITFSDQNDPTCDLSFGGNGCTGPYPSSADVPLASVDQGQHDKLRNRIDPSGPAGNTPTYTALQGAFGELESFVPSGALPPNGKKVVVLMTDGVPTDGSDMNSNSQLVAGEVSKGITTFAVGIGPFPTDDPSNYDPVFMGHLAEAGGAAPAGCNQDEQQNVANVCHFQVTPGGKSAQDLTQSFLDAINKIRGAVASCEYVLDKSGGTVDPSQVNVVYTDDSGVQHVLVEDATNGWTYDDPNNPTKVILHGSDCDQVKADPAGKISIVLGCRTVAK